MGKIPIERKITMERDNIPLSVLMEQTKGKLIMSFNRIIDEVQLPAFLVEGMLLEILAEVRKQKNYELAADIASKNAEKISEDKE